MKSHTARTAVVVVAAMLILLAACAPRTPQPATPAPATPSPAITRAARTSTAPASRTPRPTNTLVPTLTPQPTRTPTPKPDLSAAARYMTELVNRDRQAAGLSPVQWDETAARAAQAHAEEMATYVYLSHWNLAGYGPEHRYSFAGGRDAVRENVYSYYQRYSTGEGIPIQDWKAIVEQAEQALMDSPGHRDNILQPSHTHVGIGIGYNPAQGEIRIAQEFVDRYVVLDPAPESVTRGDSVQISGRILPGVSSPLINLAYEPFPTPMSVADLNQTSTYTSRAEVFQAMTPRVQGDRFSATIRIGEADKPGLYHVRIWAAQSGEHIFVGNIILTVR